MIELDIFLIIVKELIKVRGFLDKNTTIVGRLYIIILIENFY